MTLTSAEKVKKEVILTRFKNTDDTSKEVGTKMSFKQSFLGLEHVISPESLLHFFLLVDLPQKPT